MIVPVVVAVVMAVTEKVITKYEKVDGTSSFEDNAKTGEVTDHKQSSVTMTKKI